MNKFTSKHHQPTLGSIVIVAGILACQHLPIETSKIYSNEIEKDSYILDNCSSTYSQYSGLAKNMPQAKPIGDNFEKVVGQFYASLLVGQEALGEEFENALFNNLWDLYES